jgi:hypothetical protein
MKYLRQHTVSERRQQKSSMNGLLGAFLLKDFDTFFNNYKLTNILASEALIALERFISALNEFFDLCDDLTEEMIGDSKISWYSYTNITPSGDYIRAKSMYYNGPSFSDVSINMSEEESEDYNTYDGACFGKVFIR